MWAMADPGALPIGYALPFGFKASKAVRKLP
jgi:hypothetical protein